MKKLITVFIILFLLTWASLAELTIGETAFIEHIGRDCPVIKLWPDGIGPDETQKDLQETITQAKDGWTKITAVTKPSMVIVSPPEGVKNTGVAVLCCPGGGYNTLSLGNVVQEAQWLNAMGATAVLLKYRVPRRPDDRKSLKLPLQDAQRAMGILRSRAAEFVIDPNKILVSGSSAGGHLAFNLASHHKKRVYDPIDEYDKISCRPDAAILFYPAYLTLPVSSLTPNPNLHFDNFTNADIPPVFITVTRPDKFIFGAVKVLDKMQKTKVPVELHIYPTGGHGGMFNKYPLMEFARPCARFMVDHGLFTPDMRIAGDAWLDTQVPITKKKLFPNPGKNVSKAGKKQTKPYRNLPTLGNPEKELTEGEAAIQKVAGKTLPIYRLWPDRKPAGQETVTFHNGIMRITNVTAPSMTLFKPEKADGRAVLVFPGGGFKILAADHEGVKICEWLNSLGITAFLVKYTVPRPKDAGKHIQALYDALQAIKLVRSGAKQFDIDPHKVGTLGFSAGGLLTILTCYSKEYESHPNFGIPIYPACTVINKKNARIDPMLVNLKAYRLPQIFTAIAADDPFRPGAMYWFLELHKGQIPAECHVYEKGGHGQGIRPEGYPFTEWIKPCERWLNDLETIAPY